MKKLIIICLFLLACSKENPQPVTCNYGTGEQPPDLYGPVAYAWMSADSLEYCYVYYATPYTNVIFWKRENKSACWQQDFHQLSSHNRPPILDR